MLRYLNVLQEVAKTGRAVTKASLLRKGDSPILRDILSYSFSPTVAFGVGAVEYDALAPEPETAPTPLDFLILCRKMTDQELTGDAAEAAVKTHIEAYPSSYRSLVQGIFAQQLPLGMDAHQINHVIPNLIPTFGMMWANNYEAERIKYPAFVSPKMAGVRALVISDARGVVMFSRLGNTIKGVPHILEAVSTLPWGVYDGKLVHPKGYKTAIQVCKKPADRLHPDYADVTFHIFDWVDLGEWDDPQLQARTRFGVLRTILANHIDEHPATPLHPVPHHKVRSSAEMLEWHRDFVRSGYEGSMIQSDTPYIKKPTWTYLQLKDFLTLDALVMGWEQGNKTGKFKGGMGRLVCKDLTTGGIFRVGTGFVDSDREITGGWVGKIVEIKYEGRLPDGRPKFPIYIRTRTDLE